MIASSGVFQAFQANPSQRESPVFFEQNAPALAFTLNASCKKYFVIGAFLTVRFLMPCIIVNVPPT